MVEIKIAEKNELKELVGLYKVFEEHNIFRKSEEEVLKYLENVKGEFLIAKEEGKVIGALLITKKQETDEHVLIRFKHIAVAENYRKRGIGSELLDVAEKRVAPGKVEIHVVESESLEFYKKKGYVIEGELKSHYRRGEMCFIVGKVLR